MRQQGLYETGSFILMYQKMIKFLTFFTLLTAFCVEVFAASFVKEQASSHLRWNIFTGKETLVVNKKGTEVTLRSLKPQALQSIADSVRKSTNNEYIKSVQLEREAETSVSALKIQLASPDVEIFSFYKDREKKYILDFWKDKQNVVSEIPKPSEQTKEKKNASPRGERKEDSSLLRPPEGRVLKDVKVSKSSSNRKESKSKEKEQKKSEPEHKRSKATEKSPASSVSFDNEKYRDFRYGASFIWDYSPLAPSIKKQINLSRKTPTYFYPIKDRDHDKNKREAHLQLSINLYRKKKYGLMYKSIKLFREKYGEKTGSELNQYLKANALLKQNIEKGNREPFKTAISMLSNLAERTDNYEMQKGIYKYLMAYYQDVGDHVSALDIAKKLYVSSKDDYDYEQSGKAAEHILYNLSKLNQIDKLNELVQDKTINKLVPDQLVLAYKMFTLLKLDRTKDMVKTFERNSEGLTKPVHKSILFNAAEAHFRLAKYDKALNFYDDFVSEYSQIDRSGDARLRMAQIYELTQRDFEKTAELYKNAINRATRSQTSYEARIRYVAMRNLRKKELTEKDKELRVLLDLEEKKGSEKLTNNLRKLLWLVRLRTFIVDHKFKEALSYLKAIPLDALKPTERRVFKGDGAEIVYGLMLDAYKKSNYGKVVKVWELYRDKYVKKVATDPYVNFLVGKSYVNLGLFNGFDKIYQNFQRFDDHPRRTFPIWIERNNLKGRDIILQELKLVKNMELENYDLAEKNIQKLRNIAPDYEKSDYYEGLVAYRQENYKKAANSLEGYLSHQEGRGVYDPNEVAEMLLAYTDSLYQLDKAERFKEVAEAVLQDLEGFATDNKYIREVKERISYLMIETLASEGAKAALQLEPKIKKFIEDFPESSHRGRVRYLLGTTLVKNKKEKEGKKVLETLTQDQEISNTIKEMAKSELSLLKIKNRTL